MTHLIGRERGVYVQNMFTHIAHRYDLMNRIMTAGQDIRWRQEVIRQAELKPGCCLLDLGAGTGDLAREGLRSLPDIHVVAADFTLEMMRVGRSRQPAGQDLDPDWSAADAAHLPFDDSTFDSVISGFLLRNVAELDRCLSEQYRILKSGGRLVALDTTPPPKSPLAPLIRFHLHSVIPTLGKLIAGQGEAYAYLPNSTESFLAPERLSGRLLAAGFEDIHFSRWMLGTIAIHSARKPLKPVKADE